MNIKIEKDDIDENDVKVYADMYKIQKIPRG